MLCGCLAVEQVFLSACPERPGWYVILQKDSRSRRCVDGAKDPLIGLEESEGERSLVADLEQRRRAPNVHVRPPGVEVPAAIVEALPPFVPAPMNDHRTPI